MRDSNRPVIRKLSSKIVLLVCVCTGFAAICVGSFSYARLLANARSAAIDRLAGETRLGALALTDAFVQMKQDALIVARTPPVPGIIRATRNDDSKTVEAVSVDEWRSRLETIFMSILASRPHYVQMRLIELDEGGRELARINRHENEFEIVRSDLLQDKGEEPYMVAAAELAPGEVYFSPISINRENGVETAERMPVLRAVTPVNDASGKIFGVVVINVDYPGFLSEMLLKIQDDKEAFIFNSAGDFMGTDENGEIGHFQIHSEAPGATKHYLTSNIHDNQTEYVLDNAGEVTYIVRIHENDLNLADHTFVGLSLSKSRLLVPVQATLRDALLLSLFLVLLTTIVGLLLARPLTAPLNDMTQAITTHKKGDETLGLPVERQDEIGALAKAFSDMSFELTAKERRVTEQSRFLKLIMDSMPDLIFVKDDAFRIVQANVAFLSLFPEDARDKVIGYTTVEEFSEEEAKLFLEMDQKAFDEGYSEILEEIQKSGATRILFTQKIRFENASGDAFILGIARDVTEREELIEQLARSNKELDEFAYIASHDLKAPLRVIDNASRWLKEDLGDQLDEDSQENIDLIRSRATRMEALLDDLLSYSRIGRTTDRDTSDIIKGDRLMDDVLLLLDLPSGFSVEIDPAFADIQVPRMPLQQMLLNLVGNAVKHHDQPNGRVEVGVAENEAEFIFTVKDNGPGIDPQYHEQIFQMFTTLKPRDEVEGSGMGLAVVYKHVKYRGGTITLASSVGEGCTFTITWPKQSGAALKANHTS